MSKYVDEIRDIIRETLRESIEEQNFVDLSFADGADEEPQDEETAEVEVVPQPGDDESVDLDEEMAPNVTISDNGVQVEISPESVDPSRPESLESVMKSVLYMLKVACIQDMAKDVAKDYDIDQISVQMILHKLFLDDETMATAAKAISDLIRYTRESERVSDD